jgi:xylulose-5-phosphate/fructose-6-phosphate phosphoketolase
VPQGEARGAALALHCRAMLDRHRGYIREHFEDMPEVRDWRWSEP